ncbi:ABC transporter permease [Pilimelia columellifera]|uniref:Transport permease protein n=1 Tax=Pilimelia columellifera subsp. columellifera TaxID=706583 RepID=A0ABN3NCV3_9ACTN
MAEPAIAEPDVGSSAALAARHGLTVAGARPGLLRYTRQLWAYRHFIVAYANAKVASSYSSTALGRLWQVLTPLTNAAVYFLIFGLIVDSPGRPTNFIGYLCTGLFVFIFTQTAVSSGLQAIAGNLGLIRALHFPRASLPLSLTLVQLQNIIASMAVLAAIVLLTGEPLSFEWLLVVPALLLQSIFNAGLALAMARIGARMRDLKQIMPFILRTWMYGSAVLYSVALFDSPEIPDAVSALLKANPLLIYIELMRHSLMETAPLGSPVWLLWTLGLGWALLVGVGGYLFFWRGEQEYGRG